MDAAIAEQPRSGRPPLPETKRRAPLYAKVSPSTLEFLQSLGEENLGRAVDKLVILHRQLRKKKA